MGNTSSASAQSSQKTTKCNSCSQNGSYFNFGKTTDEKFYALIKGKQRRVYMDSKGRYYKQNSEKKYLHKNHKIFKLNNSKKHKKNNFGYFFYSLLTDKYNSPEKKLEYDKWLTRQYKVPKRKVPKRKVPKRKVPKRKPKVHYLRKKVKSPLRKPVKNKQKRTIGTRLSARAVFNKMGMSAIGKPFSILQKDGTYKRKYLRLRQNGSPYFANNFGRNFSNYPYTVDGMTGLRNSWPNYGYDIPPGGVTQQFNTSLLPNNKFGNSVNVPHMHYGKMCFGA